MSKTPPSREQLKALLDAHHVWPGPYNFKFIVEQARLAEVTGLFPGETPVIRPSSKGAYVSVTFTVTVDGSDQVLDTYEKARKIQGIVSL